MTILKSGQYTHEVAAEYEAFLADARCRLATLEASPPDFLQDDAATIVEFVKSALEDSAPYCLIRLGDGEGACLLDIADAFPNLYWVTLARSLSLHFGRQNYGPSDFTFWHRSIAGAIEQADIIGGPTVAQCLANARAARPDIRGSTGIIGAGEFLERRRYDIPGKTYESGYLHQAMLPHYAALARGRRVGLITCYTDDFADRLASAFECESVITIGIPGQSVNEKGKIGEPLYPNHYDRVVEEIDNKAEPGMLWLIAAGLAGKAFSVQAAARGAVAIDVGSIMDVWYGRGVRPYQSDDFVGRYRLP